MKGFSFFTFVLGLVSNFSWGNVSSEIRVNVDALPLTRLPYEIKDVAAAWATTLVGQRLISPGELHFSGDLAKRWISSDNGLTFKFELDKNARFTDGAVVKCNNVLVSFNKVFSESGAGYISLYRGNISSLGCEGDFVFVVKLKKRNDSFLALLAEPIFTVWKQSGSGPVFSGKFIWGEQTRDALTLKARGSGPSVRFIALPFDEAIARFKEGSIEILRTYSFFQLPLLNELKSSRVLKVPDERTFFIALNSSSERFSKLSERCRVLEAINVDGVEKALAKFDVPVPKSIVPFSFLMAPNNGDIKPSNKVGIREKTTSPMRSFDVFLQDGLGLEALGEVAFASLPARMKTISKSEMVSKFITGNYDALLTGYGTSVKTVDAFTLFFYSSSVLNFSRLKDPRVDLDLESSWGSQKAADRRLLGEKIEKINREGCYYFPVAHGSLGFAISKKIDSRGFPEVLSSPNLNLGKMRFF